MKRLNIFWGILTTMLLISSCKSENENLEVDLSLYSPDMPIETETDVWIRKNLTDPYNFQVQWRFERHLTDISRDISPVDENRVIPFMQLVLDGFVGAYKKTVGEVFIKRYAPKQWVLYGSGSYNDDGSLNLGTADAGRRIVIYEMNRYELDSEGARRRLRTIHHEFTHVLNQIVPIPPNFETISSGDYVSGSWLLAANTLEIAREKGFITRYARHSAGEDFADMVSNILGEGEAYFNNYLAASTPEGRTRLLAKRAIIEDYFWDGFGVTLADVQREVQAVLKNNYGHIPPDDQTETLAYWLATNRVAALRYTPGAGYLVTYGNPAMIQGVVANMQQSLRDEHTWPEATIEYLEFRPVNATDLDIRIGYKETSASAVATADFYFQMNIYPPNSTVVFSKVARRNTSNVAVQYAPEANGNRLLQGFNQYLLPYIANRTFVADWLPASIGTGSSLYRTFGGFYLQGDATNYIYGPLTLR